MTAVERSCRASRAADASVVTAPSALLGRPLGNGPEIALVLLLALLADVGLVAGNLLVRAAPILFHLGPPALPIREAAHAVIQHTTCRRTPDA